MSSVNRPVANTRNVNILEVSKKIFGEQSITKLPQFAGLGGGGEGGIGPPYFIQPPTILITRILEQCPTPNTPLFLDFLRARTELVLQTEA